MSTWQTKASDIATEIYSAFLQLVIAQGVLNDRIEPLDEKLRALIGKKKRIDGRVLRLMAISGKGGWHDDPQTRAHYAKNINVTLLDHQLSVVRGSLSFYVLDKLGQNPEMDLGLLYRRLRVLAVIAFLHDIDKALGLERNTTLPLASIEEAMERYHLNAFLAPEVHLGAEQVRYLIELVEDSQRHRNPPLILPPREYDGALMKYVALADKLDSIWLSTDNTRKEHGIEGVMSYLNKVPFFSTDVLKAWKLFDFYDPHHPFLLDELQSLLSRFSRRLSGIFPLIEVHHDGRLFMLLPASQYQSIVDASLKKLCADLPFNLELEISQRGVPALYNGRPDYQTLQDAINNIPHAKLSRLFLVKTDLQASITPELDSLLDPVDLKPTWPNISGALASPYANFDSLDASAEAALRKAALLALLLNLKLVSNKKNGIPSYAQREQALLSTLDGIIETPRPDWLENIEDDASRRRLTALWVLAVANEDDDVDTAIWGEQGLLQCWLEGKDDQPGFNAVIEGRGAQITTAVEQHFRQLLNRQRITVADENADNRCLFTDEPVAANDTIDQALGLYAVKISAFSGRDHRLETITSERSQTHVGAISIAEHKLRASIHAAKGGKPDGVPTLISSPTTCGLFGGLAMKHETLTLSPYDLNRLEIKKDTLIYHGTEMYDQRYRVARFERIPEKIADQVNFLELLLRACHRLGRPVHIFRGLPTTQCAFFYYDALSRPLADVLGGSSLRLEQFPRALERLQLAQILLKTHGLGYEVFMLYASLKTRFAATCLAWCRLHDDLNDAAKGREVGSLRLVVNQLEHELEQQPEDSPMSEQDGALVRFGQAAARIQKKPPYQASASEELLVFKLCLGFAEGAYACRQTDEASLVNGIASHLEINLDRKDKVAASQHRDGHSLRDECIAVAEQFVRDIWQGVLKGRPPTQRSRQLLESIYRMAFLRTARNQKNDHPDTQLADAYSLKK